MKTVAIGDIHGEYDKLQSLMVTLVEDHGVSLKKDTFVFLGDYVDGGTQTAQVVNFLIECKKKYPHWHFLYGNHEDLMLDGLNPKHPVYNDFYLWWEQGGRATSASYARLQGLTGLEKSLADPLKIIPPDDLVFLTDLETYYEDEKYFFVHGGVNTAHTIEWSKKNMSRYDMIWERAFIGSKFPYEKKIIFGHTIQTSHNPKTNLQPWIYPNMIGIDTMMHGKGVITAVILPEETFVTSTI